MVFFSCKMRFVEDSEANVTMTIESYVTPLESWFRKVRFTKFYEIRRSLLHNVFSVWQNQRLCLTSPLCIKKHFGSFTITFHIEE